MIDDSELRDLHPFDILDAEARKVDGFLATLHDDDWLRPTRCAGWRRRELLAHLAGSEEYNHATLSGELPPLLERAQAAGVTGMNDFNEWQVRLRADRTPEELLAEWRETSTYTRRRLREMGWDGTLTTMVGPYPAGLQAFHLAMEFAVHADDMDVPVADGERRLRSMWQARAARFTVHEYGREVVISSDGGINRISAEGEPEAELDDEGLVAACTARLPAEHPLSPKLRELLRVFA